MIIPLPSTPVEFIPGLTMRFPSRPCCNCGTESGIQVHVQDTRLTRYYLAGGSEQRFDLPLPFCSACLPTSTRRRPGLLANLLVFVLLYSLCFGLLLVVALISESQWLLENMALLSLVCAVPLMGLQRVRKRPGDGQTSYFQPVRIRGTRKQFRSGRVKKVRLDFTNPTFARAFELANAEALTAGFLDVRSL